MKMRTRAHRAESVAFMKMKRGGILILLALMMSCQLLDGSLRKTDSKENTRYLRLGESRSGTIRNDGGAIYFFRLDTPREVVIDLVAAPNSALDPVLALLNEDGQQIGADDDSGGGRNARLQRNLERGEYIVIVRPYGNSTGQYRLTIGDRPALAAVTGVPGVQQQAAMTIRTGETKTNSLQAGGRDVYQFVLDQRGYVIIDAMKTPRSNIDTMLEVQNAAGEVIARDDDSGDNLNARIIQSLEAGSYRIIVSGYTGSTGEYRLGVQSLEGRSLAIGQGQTGVLQQGERAVYMLELRESGIFTIDMARVGNTALDPVLTIQNLQGRTIAAVDDTDESLDAGYTGYLEQGTYLIYAGGSDNYGGNFRITVSRSRVPQQASQEIGLGDTREGWIIPGQKHSYRFNMERKQYIMVRAEAAENSMLDPYLTIKNSKDETVESNNDYGNGKNSKIIATLDQGSYSFIVNGFDNKGGKYRLIAKEVKTEPIALGQSRTGALGPGDIALYSLNLSKGSYCTIYYERTGESRLDPFLTLKTDVGRLIKTDDDSGGNLNSRITQILPAGKYLIQASGLGESAGLYRISVREMAIRSIRMGDTKIDQIEPGESHAYELTMKGRENAVIDLVRDGDSGYDPYLEVHSRDGKVIASDDDSGGERNAKVMHTLEPGQYTIIAKGYGNSGGRYSLSIRRAGDESKATPRQSRQSVQGQQSTITPGQRRMGTLTGAGHADSYTMTITAATRVLIRAKKRGVSLLDTYLELFDQSGGLIASNDDSSGTTNSSIERDLQPGQYRIMVRGYNNTLGAYLLSVVVLNESQTNGTR